MIDTKKKEWLHTQKEGWKCSFNILVYRLNTLLEQTEYTREYERILNTAVTHGFYRKLVDKKITNFRRLN